MISSPIGTIIGPFNFNFNTLRLAKLVDVSSRPDSVKARHILISSNDKDSEIKIDSLKNIISNGQSFSKLAQEFSDDKGSAVNGGDLGWFSEGMMVEEFNDACFNAKKGDLIIVKTQFGTHLIELLEKSKSTKKFEVAYLDRQITYSNTTYQNVFSRAGKFAAENSNYDQFNMSVSSQNPIKEICR